MSGGEQPHMLSDASIAPVSFVPGVSVGAASGLTSSVKSAKSASGPCIAAFAAANAAGSRTSNGKTLRCSVLGGGNRSTSTVATSVAEACEPVITPAAPATLPMKFETTIAESAAMHVSLRSTLQRTRAAARCHNVFMVPLLVDHYKTRDEFAPVALAVNACG